MGLHVIVGAGAIGGGLAERLAASGHTVKLVTRSGSGPRAEGIEHIAADAADSAALTRVAAGAEALYNCANPAYHRWELDWPPLAQSLLGAAEATGAGLVIMGNLYGYGPVDRAMTEDLPLAATSRKGRVRAKMWTDALAAHEAGRARVTELRASDFFGPGVRLAGAFGDRLMPRLLAGKSFTHFAALDAEHTWSYVPDVTAALERLGTSGQGWGRAWHAPSGPPRTVRQMVAGFAAAAGVPTPRMSTVPRVALRAVGLVVPMIRELEEVRYQHVRPFVMDSAEFTATFGLTHTALEEAQRQTVDWWRERSATPAAA